VQSERDGTLTLALPNDHHRQRCEEHRPAVEAALAAATGAPASLVLVADPAAARDDTGPIVAPRRSQGGDAPGAAAPAAALPPDDDIDLDDLVDAPPADVATPVDRLAEAFPGSELLDTPE
jgi:DNA polymerase-3 subunit gamma/tau